MAHLQAPLFLCVPTFGDPPTALSPNTGGEDQQPCTEQQNSPASIIRPTNHSSRSSTASHSNDFDSTASVRRLFDEGTVAAAAFFAQTNLWRPPRKGCSTHEPIAGISCSSLLRLVPKRKSQTPLFPMMASVDASCLVPLPIPHNDLGIGHSIRNVRPGDATVNNH